MKAKMIDRTESIPKKVKCSSCKKRFNLKINKEPTKAGSKWVQVMESETASGSKQQLILCPYCGTWYVKSPSDAKFRDTSSSNSLEVITYYELGESETPKEAKETEVLHERTDKERIELISKMDLAKLDQDTLETVLSYLRTQ